MTSPEKPATRCGAYSGDLMMSFHRTPTGSVELLSSWGHGQGVPANTERPATLVTDDGDGHYQQWKFTGDLNDALVTLARLEKFITGNYDPHVAVRCGAGYRIEPTPDDFWIDERTGKPPSDDEFEQLVPNLAAYPGVIAY
jgi:hypothetical protein